MAVRTAENTIPGTLVDRREIGDSDLRFINLASAAFENSGAGIVKAARVEFTDYGGLIIDVYNYTPDKSSFEEFDSTIKAGKDFYGRISRVVKDPAARLFATEQHLIVQLQSRQTQPAEQQA